jgi:hypothetical protein
VLARRNLHAKVKDFEPLTMAEKSNSRREGIANAYGRLALVAPWCVADLLRRW